MTSSTGSPTPTTIRATAPMSPPLSEATASADLTPLAIEASPRGVGIAAVKVLNSAGHGTESQVIQGIDWCVAQGVDGISMSLGTATGSDGNDAISLAVDNAVPQPRDRFRHRRRQLGRRLDHGRVPRRGPRRHHRGSGRQGRRRGAAGRILESGTDPRRAAKPDVVAPGVAITAAQSAPARVMSPPAAPRWRLRSRPGWWR